MASSQMHAPHVSMDDQRHEDIDTLPIATHNNIIRLKGWREHFIVATHLDILSKCLTFMFVLHNQHTCFHFFANSQIHTCYGATNDVVQCTSPKKRDNIVFCSGKAMDSKIHPPWSRRTLVLPPLWIIMIIWERCLTFIKFN